MTNTLPLPDSSTAYVNGQTGRPTKDFYNWLKSLASPASLAPAVAFSAYNALGQAGIADSVSTQVLFPSEAYDVGGYFSSNSWTPPAGNIHLCGGVVGQAVGGSGTVNIAISIYKNGSEIRQVYSGHLSAAFSGGDISIEDQANGTDTYIMKVFCANAGGTTSLLTGAQYVRFYGHWIGP